jgi:hypothetical protein
LVGDVVDWVRGRGLRLADKRTIDNYVAEKGINLSMVAREELKQMVNYRLSAPSF